MFECIFVFISWLFSHKQLLTSDEEGSLEGRISIYIECVNIQFLILHISV